MSLRCATPAIASRSFSSSAVLAPAVIDVGRPSRIFWVYGVQVRNHDRKQRREARRNPKKRASLAKDPGIPNLCPYKDDFIRRV